MLSCTGNNFEINTHLKNVVFMFGLLHPHYVKLHVCKAVGLVRVGVFKLMSS